MAMTGYTKLFTSILASTIWREDDKTRLVWITLLAMTDKNGVVEGSIPGLADLARVSIEDCERALANLHKPDKYSRSQEHDGRRIETIDGGWLVLNRAKYRDKITADDRRDRDRERQRRYRQSKSVTPSVTPNRDSHVLSHSVTTEREIGIDIERGIDLCRSTGLERIHKENQNPSPEPTNGSCVGGELSLTLSTDQEALAPPLNEKKRKQKAKKEPDPRHQPFREKLEKFWTYVNPDISTANWNAADAGQLGRLLREWPALTIKEFHQWLVNYSQSDGINPPDRPHEFLPKLHRYADGPKDRYGKPREDLTA